MAKEKKDRSLNGIVDEQELQWLRPSAANGPGDKLAAANAVFASILKNRKKIPEASLSPSTAI